MTKRGLQTAVAVAAVVPVAAGLAGAVEGAALLGEHWPGASLDSHLRYLSGLLLGIGLAYWAMIPRIERHRALFGALSAIVALGGLARLLGLLLVAERPGAAMQAALVMELAVTPALAVWQARFARDHARMLPAAGEHPPS